MRQVIQHFRSGLTEIIDTPAPAARAGHLLIRTSVSLVSAGTERMLVEFGRSNLLGKARQQPDKVRMVLDKVRTDGLGATFEAVTAKLDQPIPLGYCNVGTVIGVGPGVTGFQVGDRVASNGPHAEVVRVPVNLCAPVPDAVDDETAAFTVAGAIALQGVRLLQPTLGETIVVTGLGLVGLLAVQILRANGCRVIGIDLDAGRLSLAGQLGAETINASTGVSPVGAALALTGGRGVDGVLITASTDSNRPVADAAQMCRKRGRIVLVGVAGLELSRADFYAKELSFQVSCSYGPGRYDPQYEERGNDYPIGFVRWTEQRNLEAILELMASRSIRTDQLVTHRVPIDDAQRAYEALLEDRKALGILLQYPPRAGDEPALVARTIELRSAPPAGSGKPGCGFIGAGNYASRILLPAFVAAGARLRTVVTSGSVQGAHAGRKFGFEQVSTDVDALLADGETRVVVIATRHDSHADLAARALAAGKHVFVEKPLAVTRDQLETVRSQLAAGGAARPVLTVGFNRRFAPHVRTIARLLAGSREPRAFIYTVNAGMVPSEHWTQDRESGGGRIVGEACHFVDLLRFLSGSPVADVAAAPVGGGNSAGLVDSATLTLRFANGDAGTIHYLANGHLSFPKERLEVFVGGRVLQLDNFLRLRGYGWPGFKGERAFRQDKGQRGLAGAFLAAVMTGQPDPIPPTELLEVAEVTLRCAELLENRGRRG